MTKINRMIELIGILNKASDAYYNTGNTIMTDQEFDSMMEELKCLEQETKLVLSNSPTHNVGTEVKTQLNKIKHTRPMLSLDKCHAVQELIEFAGSDLCYMSVKCDGLTTRLIYENGELVGAETRGDGEIGQDVLFHVKEYTNVPMTIPYTGKFVIDGESVIFNSDFLEINLNLPENEQFSNPRNLASGTLSNLDSNVTKQRHMKFIAWRVIEGDDIDSNFLRLKRAEMSGFTIAPIYTYKNGTYDESHIENMLHSLRKTANDIGLPMDGVVMAKDSELLAMSMGRTSKFFRHSIAYKFDDEEYVTKLQYIDWTLGRTGILTPTAVFDPVEIDGTEVSRASMHNLSVMKELSKKHVYYKGMKLTIYKANQIIPQVRQAIGNLNDEINSEIFKTPTHCPVCGGNTAIQKDNESEVLVCTNSDCAGKKLAQFTHFVSKKGMDIKNLSEATLNILISHGFLHNYKDIYHLSTHRNELISLDCFGEKSIDNLLKSIEDSRNVKLENFIAALGIDGIGLSASKTISSHFDGDFNKFIETTLNGFDFTELNDFGKTMNANIQNFIYEHGNAVMSLAAEMHFVSPEEYHSNDTSLVNLRFCLTGTFSQPRDKLKSQLEARGAKFVSSVSKNLDILFCGERAGSKLTKAQQLGIRIADEDELMKMLEG